ncbi:alpha-hydroxy acid oxidase [Polynucleobacter sphagniphilus]|uniref:alpha-hydroxy acid oxidase n=1 Tax=Polynucleobacter sphagniphilus TaxID=1743169 RepID=UPI002476BB70|nr:alpha-hydroxy acid oxidase [Polynucleobacter sphagniphilus]MDH6525445.1 4-hydroxymandelate oxidase [Polynucleobacter sphagniphilus]
MKHSKYKDDQRRQFLSWLAASPLLALGSSQDLLAQEKIDPRELLRNYSEHLDPMMLSPKIPFELISSPQEAINVFDFEPVAFKRVPLAHFAYMATGIDDEVTLRANRSAFQKFPLRPRRMRDVSHVDTSITLFGSKWKSPIMIAPTGGNKAYDPEGEVAVARAARAGGYLNVLSAAGASTIEEVVAARQGEVWFSLYATSSTEVAKQVVQRVERAGVPVLEITVDRNGGRNQETFFRLKKMDSRTCSNCHVHGFGSAQERPIYDGIDMTGINMSSSNMTWDFIQKMRDVTKMKIVLKGILTEEDASLCLKYGVDGIHVSNHGGRSEDGGRGAIECLPEVAKVAKGKVPILFDSGVRRGSDVFKAMALGANAVCIGRPYLWGLGAFGQPGVERVMEILQTEFKSTMQQMGAPNIAAIQSSMVFKGA